MDWSSWLLRSVSRSSDNSKNSQNSNQQIPKPGGGGGEEEQLGVTQQLIDHVKSFTIDTFKNFPLQEDEATPSSTKTSSNVQRDLSEWQERHATLVLSKAKELSHLRFMLCPRHLKERQFWMIYFMLVKSHVAEKSLAEMEDFQVYLPKQQGENKSTTILPIRAACHTTG
uniref:BSD domain-containing protein n=1 Tax=Populus trichocarpa TaxID=3694 RepID=A0A2K2BNS1_POPTR